MTMASSPKNGPPVIENGRRWPHYRGLGLASRESNNSIPAPKTIGRLRDCATQMPLPGRDNRTNIPPSYSGQSLSRMGLRLIKSLQLAFQRCYSVASPQLASSCILTTAIHNSFLPTTHDKPSLAMRALSLLIVFPLAAQAALNGRCTGSQATGDWREHGICITTSTCASFGGYNKRGACPNDPDNVRCCIVGTADDWANDPCGGNPGSWCDWTSNSCSGTRVSGMSDPLSLGHYFKLGEARTDITVVARRILPRRLQLSMLPALGCLGLASVSTW